MKILFSDNSLWSLLHFRGVVIRDMLDKGHQIILVAPYENIIPSKLIEGVQMVYVKLDRTNTGIKSDITYLNDLLRIFRKYKPDLIFQYTLKPTLYGSIAARYLSISTISMLAGTGDLFQKNLNFKYKIARLLMRLSLQFTKKLILLNEDDQKKLLHEKYVKPSQIVLLKGGEGVDIRYYSPSEIYKPNQPRKFIMVGRVLYDKGYTEYVQVAKKIRDKFPGTEFLMLGYLDAMHPRAVSEQIIIQDTEDGSINYMGTVEDVRSIVGACDCFVLPSFYNEGMNRSLMEAISMGKPVISTDNKGCREMIQHGVNGYLVRPKDLDSLYQAILALCKKSDKELTEMGRNSRNLAINHFSDRIVVNEYCKLLD